MEIGDDRWKARVRDYNKRQRLLRGQCACGALYPEEHTARREGVIEGLREALEIVGAHSTVETPEAIERDIRAEIERLRNDAGE